MQPTPSYLTSPTLSFDRDGSRLISVEPDRVEIRDLSRGNRVRIDQPNALSAIGFADQIWIASQNDECLHRYTPTGSPIGAKMILPFAEHPMFVAAPCGPPTAIWGEVALHAEGTGAQLVTTPLPPDNIALPITHRRFAISAWRKLLIPSGRAAQFDVPISGGAVLAVGSRAAVMLGLGAARELALVSLGDGTVTSRFTIPRGVVRLATRSGLVVMLTDPMTLVAVELETGHVLATMQLARATRDVAIDPQGKRVALRSDRVDVVAVDDLLRWSVTTTQPLHKAG